jgi:hypothetical protein
MRRPRWTAECTALLEQLNAQGSTDTEIADAIGQRTGIRFSRRWICAQRRAHQLGSCWRRWQEREKGAAVVCVKFSKRRGR